GRDRALHVVRAAADQQSVLDISRERVTVPAVAGGNDVEVSGEAEVRRAFAPDRDHVFGGPVGRLAHDPAVTGETERLQRILENVEDFAARWSDAWAVDQLARKRDGVDRHLHGVAKERRMPKLDLDNIEQTNRTGYPPPFDKDVAGRWYR